MTEELGDEDDDAERACGRSAERTRRPGKVGENGDYENVSEYVRDLIRRDKAAVEAAAFDRLKAELTRAFDAPEKDYAPLGADEVIARNAPPGA